MKDKCQLETGSPLARDVLGTHAHLSLHPEQYVIPEV